MFRLLFGLLAALAAVRFVAMGWVETLLLAPMYHFAWFDWAVVPSAPILYGLFVAQVVGGLGLALTRWPRVFGTLWLASFVYVELLDKALYLNHYVLMSLVGATLLLASHGPRIGRWWLLLLRVEVGLVYFWAGVCKLNPDWLFRAEPLATWLGARVDLPWVGPILAAEPTAYAMAWSGCAFDLMVPFLLLSRRTRPVTWVVLAGFHAVLGVLFPIGVFPWLMVICATLFADPTWTSRWRGCEVEVRSGRLSVVGTSAWFATVLLLSLWPGRWLLTEDVAWTERGHRFSWRVLIVEKTGMVEYRIVHPDGAVEMAYPRDVLTDVQLGQLQAQPDLIRQYAQYLGAGRDVAVYADAFASLHRRPVQRLIDPEVDLAAPVEGEWILRRGCSAARSRATRSARR